MISFEEMRAELKTLKVSFERESDVHQKWVDIADALIDRHGQRGVDFWVSEIASKRMNPRKTAAVQVALDRFQEKERTKVGQQSVDRDESALRFTVIGAAAAVISVLIFVLAKLTD